MGVFKWDMLLCLCVDGGCIGCYNETYQLLHSTGGVGVENHTELSITASWEEWGGDGGVVSDWGEAALPDRVPLH